MCKCVGTILSFNHSFFVFCLICLINCVAKLSHDGNAKLSDFGISIWSSQNMLKQKPFYGIGGGYGKVMYDAMSRDGNETICDTPAFDNRYHYFINYKDESCVFADLLELF